jgi:MFS family permease
VFTTLGMIITAVSLLLLDLLPINFAYWQFALILLLVGAGQGLFGAPNRAAIMNSLPPDRRGVGSGMAATFQNSATVLSIGIFFTLIILGLAATLASALSHGLTAEGVPPASAARVAGLPPVRRRLTAPGRKIRVRRPRPPPLPPQRRRPAAASEVLAAVDHARLSACVTGRRGLVRRAMVTLKEQAPRGEGRPS